MNKILLWNICLVFSCFYWFWIYRFNITLTKVSNYLNWFNFTRLYILFIWRTWSIFSIIIKFIFLFIFVFPILFIFNFIWLSLNALLILKFLIRFKLSTCRGLIKIKNFVFILWFLLIIRILAQCLFVFQTFWDYGSFLFWLSNLVFDILRFNISFIFCFWSYFFRF